MDRYGRVVGQVRERREGETEETETKKQEKEVDSKHLGTPW